jgi:hypothetical protein
MPKQGAQIESKRLQLAFKSSLDDLGQTPRDILLSYLTERGISLDGVGCPSIRKIESVLEEIIGKGAHVLTANTYHKIKSERIAAVI